ncbi:hypothetical protein PT974_01626 [Cladobotryum mycophilum]|uniref:F-box domain-containing protein n=1 Tax=Cladobotryum mycophilum TaxID=491253 RepID=A0ABR0T4I1_9HYPO
MDDSSTVTLDIKTGLAYLPGELLLRILENDAISHDDRKALRLVCRRLSSIATLLLFSRICISKLHADREAFLNVALRPHLARAVRTVVWYELAEDERSFIQVHRASRNLEYRPRNFMDRGGDESHSESFLDKLVAQACQMFWLPSEDLQEYIDEEQERPRKEERAAARKEAIETFLPWFFVALDGMPGLTTLVSQPMHPLRELPTQFSCHSYPMTAQLFQAGATLKKNQMNEGLCSFFIPYMVHRGDSYRLSPITNLHVADEGQFSFITRIEHGFERGFSALSRLDLCLSHIEDLDDLEELVMCLAYTENLTELRKLRSLHLEDIRVTNSVLAKFIESIASSLKFLRLGSCRTSLKTMDDLADIKGLNLESLMITSDTGSHSYVQEDLLLRYLKGDKEWLDEMEPNLEPNSVIFTHLTVYDMCAWRTAAFFDVQAKYDCYTEIETQELRDEVESEYSYCEEVPDDYTSQDESEDKCQEEDEGESTHDTDSSSSVTGEVSTKKHVRDSPRWNYSMDSTPGGQIYYWKITAEDKPQRSFPTTTWRFTHRNGETALGEDPLEWWASWEGSEAGDICEATPFGDHFEDFLSNHDSDRDGRRMRDSKFIPYGRATLYEPERGSSVNEFFERNEEVKIKVSRGIEASRTIHITEGVIRSFWDRLDDEIKAKSVSMNRIYNLNETGLTEGKPD